MKNFLKTRDYQSFREYLSLPKPAIFATGKYCRLGVFHPAYAPIFWRYINEQHDGLGRRGPVGYDSEEKWIERNSGIGARVQAQPQYFFVVFPKTGRIPAGTISLCQTKKEGEDTVQNFLNEYWHTGTFIAKPWQSQGIGSDAKMLLLHWVSLHFTHQEVPEIWSHVYDFNKASLRTQEKCGYTLVIEGKTPPDDVQGLRKGRNIKAVWLKVTPGQSWLQIIWNPYAEKHGLEVWSAPNL